jgi:peptidoglycan/xylan/chitin deacetylase (PgdA/CDA1 family)
VLEAIGAAARVTKKLSPTIFCFHSVQSAATRGFRSALSVTDRFIERLIETLDELSVPIISLPEADARIQARDMRAFVVLSFDDGYLDNYTTLYPLMLKHRVPFTIFVTTGLLDQTVPMWWDTIERLQHWGGDLGLESDGSAQARWRANPLTGLTARFRDARPAVQAGMVDELRRLNPGFTDGGSTLSWAMLEEMQQSGLLTVGAHGVHHPLLSRLSPAELKGEMLGARTRIEEMLDIAPEYFAYPFGQQWEIGEQAADAAGDAGYAAAFTTEAVPLSAADADRPFGLPRVLLSKKADHPDVAIAYMSGLPAQLNRLAGRR